jgi:two-component system sensor histidine kinase PhoQ
MHKTYSINQRTILATSVVLACFLGIVGWVLDIAFRDSAAQSVQQNLESTLYGLIAVAEVNTQQQLSIPNFLTDERLNRPGSGLYALITDTNNKPSWQSRSLLGESVPATAMAAVGQRLFRHAQQDSLFIYSAGIAWEIGEGRELDYTFNILTNQDSYLAQVQQFRQSLWGWLGLVAIGLLIIQILLLRWSLSPLRRVADDLVKVESGKQEQLGSDYPHELQGVTHNLNRLLGSRQHQLTRYRNALANLAHSLKTPLAILRGLDPQADNQQALHEQTSHMNRIIDYQLQRASTAAHTGLIHQTVLQPVIQRIVQSLEKVYVDRQLAIEIDIAGSLSLAVDENDLMELAGNLLDNAFKWSSRQIRVSADQDSREVRLMIDDDGKGIDSETAQRLFKRGARADMTVDGQGIGLAVSHEIISAYQGNIDIQSSDLGGTRVITTLPR